MPKKHFVLVHGFGHGAWCWYKLKALLESNGARVTALDLAGCGMHPARVEQISSISEFVRPLMDFLASLSENEKVILVGHSYGGIPISLGMEKFCGNISLAVFVTAYMPNCTDAPDTLILEYFGRAATTSFMDCDFTFDQNLPISALFGPDFMASTLYKNCSLEDLELAKMLIRPNLFLLEDLGKKSLLSEKRYGRIKRCYVICEKDEVMKEDFQRFNIEKNPPNEVISIAGAGHMVMLTKTQELCSCLLQLSEKYNKDGDSICC